MVLLIVLPFILLAVVGVGVLYVRLANGPMSLAYLKPAIERQIGARLGGRTVHIGDVVLSLVEHRAAIRLRDVRLDDEGGETVAEAPLARMEIDTLALLGGRMVPSGIVLIRPLMRLAYSAEFGLTLSLSGADRASEQMTRTRAAQRTTAGAVRPAGASRPLIIAPSPRSVTPETVDGKPFFAPVLQALEQMTSGAGEGAGLDKIGVRNAIIELEVGGRVSRWGVPSSDIEMGWRGDKRVVTALATVAASAGRNASLSFHAETAQLTKQTEMRLTARDLDPSALAKAIPDLGALAKVQVPVSVEAVFDVDGSGGLVGGNMTAEVGRGPIRVSAGTTKGRLPIESGRFVVRFTEGLRQIIIEPSTLRWDGNNEIVVSGRASQTSAGFGDGYAFSLKSKGGHLALAGRADDRQPIEAWSVEGRVSPNAGVMEISEGIVAAGGGRLKYSARLGGPNGMADLIFDGAMADSPMRALPYLWPRILAPDARSWVRANLLAGDVTRGTIKIDWQGRPADTQSVTLEGENLQFMSMVSQLPVFAERGLVRFKGAELEVDIPRASLRFGRLRSIELRQAKLRAPNVLVENPVSKLSFKMAGKIRDAIGVVTTTVSKEDMPAGLQRLLKQGAKGQIDGDLSLEVPLYDRAGWTPALTGSFVVKEIAAKDVIGPYDISSGLVNVDIAPKSVKVSGEMLIEGVAAQLDWQYILEAPLANQPPIRLRAQLDEADRTKLGLRVNHILAGVVDLDAAIIPLPEGRFGSRVRANLTKAAIAFESLAWVKPPGRSTQLEFDVSSGKKYPITFENVRMVGDGIAIRGRAMINKAYKLAAFNLPLFSIDRVTRLTVRGELDKSDIWRVFVKGQTFEGRSLFRSLFQAGRIQRANMVPARKQMGVDLQAEIDTVLGYWNTNLTEVRLSLSKRQGKIQAMDLTGLLSSGGRLKAGVVPSVRGRRELQAVSNNAGNAFRLAGFYPNMQNGRFEIAVNLDGQGAAEKNGVLVVRRFRVLDDGVVNEMAQAPRGGVRRRASNARSGGGQALDFDWMRAPFFIGNGQFVLQGAELRGPVVGATIQGKADFSNRTVDLSGTYVPLQGLNAALGVLPGIGQILAGPRGEGVLGMKFAVRGGMANPEVLVNPLSLMAPGIFREIFQLSSPSLEVTPRASTSDQGRDQERATADERAGGLARSPSQPNDSGATKWRRGVFGEQ